MQLCFAPPPEHLHGEYILEVTHTLTQEHICIYETICERLGVACPELVALDSRRTILSVAPANIMYRCVLSS